MPKTKPSSMHGWLTKGLKSEGNRFDVKVFKRSKKWLLCWLKDKKVEFNRISWI